MLQETGGFPFSNVAEMYRTGLPQSIFPGNAFTNYGTWRDLDFSEGEITPDARIESQRNLYRIMSQETGISNRSRVVEVGVGRGGGAGFIVDRFDPRSYTGVDFSAAQIQRAKTVLQKHPEIALVLGDAGYLPFHTASFDILLSVEAIQYFPDPKDFLREGYRVLSPGGKIGICAFFADEHMEQNVQWLKETFPTIQLGIDHFYPVGDIEKWLKESGFINTRVQREGEYVWEQLVKFVHQVEPNQSWSDNFITAWQRKMIDYFLIFAEKPKK